MHSSCPYSRGTSPIVLHNPYLRSLTKPEVQAAKLPSILRTHLGRLVVIGVAFLSLHVVDDFREVAQLMLKTHRFTGQAPREGDNGGRVEFLPVHWHTALHGDDTGVDW